MIAEKKEFVIKTLIEDIPRLKKRKNGNDPTILDVIEWLREKTDDVVAFENDVIEVWSRLLDCMKGR